MATSSTTVGTSTPKTILVATDFAACAEAALDHALALAPALGAKVYLLHAYALPLAAFPGGDFMPRVEVGPKILASAEAAVAQAIAKAKQSGVEILPVVKEGDPREVIKTTAEELGADLIVLGTHGRRGIVRAIFGSVAEAVVRSSLVPVMTVHAPEPVSATTAERPPAPAP